MAIQLSSITKYLASKNIPFKELEKHVLVEFEVETARGKTDAIMCFSAPADGQVFSVESVHFLPKEVVAKLIDNQQFVLSLLNMAWGTPFGGCELGGSEGPELRFVVEVPLMDATLTEAQFQTVVNGVKNGTKIVCDLALEALGKTGTGTQEPDLMQQLKAAASLIASKEASGEDKQKAYEFVAKVAESGEVDAEVRAAAARLLQLIHEALEEVEKAQGSNTSPFA